MHNVTLIKGDGIGPSIMEVAVKIILLVKLGVERVPILPLKVQKVALVLM